MILPNSQYLSWAKRVGILVWFGLVCEFWFVCLFKHFLFMVEVSIFVWAWNFGVLWWFFKSDIVVSYFNVSWKNWLAIYFNYFTGTHMIIFEEHFLITHCLVFWSSFFPPTGYSLQDKIPWVFFLVQNKNTKILLLVVGPHPTCLHITPCLTSRPLQKKFSRIVNISTKPALKANH